MRTKAESQRTKTKRSAAGLSDPDLAHEFLCPPGPDLFLQGTPQASVVRLSLDPAVEVGIPVHRLPHSDAGKGGVRGQDGGDVPFLVLVVHAVGRAPTPETARHVTPRERHDRDRDRDHMENPNPMRGLHEKPSAGSRPSSHSDRLGRARPSGTGLGPKPPSQLLSRAPAGYRGPWRWGWSRQIP